jgi:hypothetical protein
VGAALVVVDDDDFEPRTVWTRLAGRVDGTVTSPGSEVFAHKMIGAVSDHYVEAIGLLEGAPRRSCTPSGA